MVNKYKDLIGKPLSERITLSSTIPKNLNSERRQTQLQSSKRRITEAKEASDAPKKKKNAKVLNNTDVLEDESKLQKKKQETPVRIGSKKKATKLGESIESSKTSKERKKTKSAIQAEPDGIESTKKASKKRKKKESVIQHETGDNEPNTDSVSEAVLAKKRTKKKNDQRRRRRKEEKRKQLHEKKRVKVCESETPASGSSTQSTSNRNKNNCEPPENLDSTSSGVVKQKEAKTQRKANKMKTEDEEEADESLQKKRKKSSLQIDMEAKLAGARFRQINEELYTSSSAVALQLFNDDPDLFSVYHEGLKIQSQKWPVDPLDHVIEWVRENVQADAVIADMGCGDAKLAKSVAQQVYSFDFKARKKRVIECDMANVPLENHSCDVVVFCLSLMNTNVVDFLAEAHRVLKEGGRLKIAEVASRFSDVRQFIKATKSSGFKLIERETLNSFFFVLEFEKNCSAFRRFEHGGFQLVPCVYKKR